MLTLTQEEWEKIPDWRKGEWSTDNVHGTELNGKKTLFHYGVLLIESQSFQIIENGKNNSRKVS